VLSPPPHKENAKRLLTLYTDDRALTTEQINQATVLATVERSQQLHAQLWQLALDAAEQTPTPITALFMSAMNDVIDLQQERITMTKQQRMPWVFWVALIFLTILTMLLAGHDAGHAGAKRSVSNVVVTVAFSIVFSLVVALDRPFHRFNLINQEPFFDLRATMDELEPAS
jgi:fatty acid desaturase